MPRAYRIRVGGHLDAAWDDWFGGLKITNLPEGEAELTGELADEAALHSVLARVRDLGLPLLSAQRLSSQGDAAF